MGFAVVHRGECHLCRATVIPMAMWHCGRCELCSAEKKTQWERGLYGGLSPHVLATPLPRPYRASPLPGGSMGAASVLPSSAVP